MSGRQRDHRFARNEGVHWRLNGRRRGDPCVVVDRGFERLCCLSARRSRCALTAASWQTAVMDVAKLAKGQAVNRVLIGAGLVLAPRVFARPWVGRYAADASSQVLARSLGVRDAAVGGAGLLALARDDSDWLRLAFAVMALADAVGFAVIVAGNVPASAKLVGGTMAAGSAAVAAAYARRLS